MIYDNTKLEEVLDDVIQYVGKLIVIAPFIDWLIESFQHCLCMDFLKYYCLHWITQLSETYHDVMFRLTSVQLNAIFH